MKIGSVYSVIGQYSMQRTEAAPVKPKAYSAADRVELSANAQLFTEAFALAKQHMQQEAPDQAIRVSDIINRIRSGAYSVETGDILDKLLA